MKPKLLVVELWGLGDLIIATPFLKAASERFDLTVLAKPYANDLQPRFWPHARVIPFVAPWTAFKGKYRVFSWPWREMFRLRRLLRSEKFDYGLSARWDPRDHFLLSLARAKNRLGFPRLRSEFFLTHSLHRPDPRAHRYENWRVMAHGLGFHLPTREKLAAAPPRSEGEVLFHTGAGQPVRVWPLGRYRALVEHLRSLGYRVRIACDPDQQSWWKQAGEAEVEVPHTVTELIRLVDKAAAFIGNDSGPGHLAAFSGVPTFTIFGPQLPEWFTPLHPFSESLEGKACPYKPCSDYCRFPEPYCLTRVTEEEALRLVEAFLARLQLAPQQARLVH